MVESIRHMVVRFRPVAFCSSWIYKGERDLAMVSKIFKALSNTWILYLKASDLVSVGKLFEEFFILYFLLIIIIGNSSVP